jgi:hypothetical protein
MGITDLDRFFQGMATIPSYHRPLHIYCDIQVKEIEAL